MSAFFDRLQHALRPEYELLRELGSGGMGSVFLVRDVALDAPRAVKVLPPELWTADAAKLFVKEAQILAALRHPHTVPVHNVDERDGLNFYVMEYLEGETLRDHLEKHGALSVDAARKLGRDLLAALGKAHRHGVIHRDVKPGNLFLGAEGAVLTDFGIARRLTDEEKSDPQILRGTAAYMAPEQFAGVEADERTDIYAAGMVIYEAFTGTRWPKCASQAGDWTGIPSNIARALRRALELERDDRWADVVAFRKALWHTREWKYQRRTIMLTAAGLIVGATLAVVWRQPILGFFRASSRIQIEPFAFSGPAAEQRWLGDSISCSLAVALARYPDLEIRGPCEPGWGLLKKKRMLQGRVYSDGHQARVVVGPGPGSWSVTTPLSASAWRAGVGDLSELVFDSLVGGSRFLEPTLPRAVLPKTPVARKAFLDGEHAFARAQWGEAYASYGVATAADSSCWMCYWRHAEVGRWLSLSQDTADVMPYRRARDQFPATYRGLIAAEALPLKGRLDGFGDVVRRQPDFFFGRFRFADEEFHRGPLVGRDRGESLSLFTDVLRNRHDDFGPAWEHLAWAYTAEGDSLDAAGAIARLRATGPSRDPITVQIRALVEAAFACRFLSVAQCRGVIGAELQGAEAAGGSTVDAGARWLPYYDAQVGAIELARLLVTRPQFARSAMLAQAFADVGLGRVDSARAMLGRIVDRFRDSDLSLFSEELDAVLVAFDPDSARLAGWPALQAALADRADLSTTPVEERARAAWMLAIASYRLGKPTGMARARPVLDREAASSPLHQLVVAVEVAGSDPHLALHLSEPLTGLEANASDPDPYFRTVLHLLRAEWYRRAHSDEGERRELIWYQNSDVYGYPVDRPQMAEVDWAFGTLARWKIALLATGDAACRASRDVARLWAGGDPVYRARADSAAQRHAALGCQPHP